MKKFKNLSLLLILLVSITSCAAGKKKNTDSDTTATSTDTYVDINTPQGVITVMLYSDVPQHSQNFAKLAGEGFYDSTLFHRVIQGFMIQGGDPTSKNAQAGQMLGMGDNGYRIPAEFDTNHVHTRGALAMARDNNPEKASSGCQFYIVQGKPVSEEQLHAMEGQLGIHYSDSQIQKYVTEGGTPFLDMNYTVFGEVVNGMEVVDAIAATTKAAGDRPTTDVIMTMHVLTPKEVKQRFSK